MTLDVTQPPPFRIEDALEEGIHGIDYIHNKHRNLLGSTYYHRAIEDDLRAAEARHKYRFQRESDRSEAYQKLFEAEKALTDLTRK